MVAGPTTSDLDPVVAYRGRFAQVLQSPGVVVATTADLDPARPLTVIVPRPGGTSWTTTEATVAGRVEDVRVAARALATPQGVAQPRPWWRSVHLSARSTTGWLASGPCCSGSPRWRPSPRVRRSGP